jgi:L-asparaginase
MASVNTPASLPCIALVATGGTIAGQLDDGRASATYTAGVLGADALLAAVPELASLATIEASSPFSIDSKDITSAHWLALARHVRSLLDRDEIAGVVITHGTDTLEETAYFLHLVLPAGKPVVLTAAMRPANALSPDGPLNLYQAVRVAASGVTAEIGVVVVVQQQIFGASDFSKVSTRGPAAFAAPNDGVLGWAEPPRLLYEPADLRAGALPLERLDTVSELPCVEVVYVAGGSAPVFLQNLPALGVRAVVLALPGNGSLPAHWETAVEALREQDIPVVLASRTGAGPVSATASLRFGEPAGRLSPVQARIALMLGLAVGQH